MTTLEDTAIADLLDGTTVVAAVPADDTPEGGSREAGPVSGGDQVAAWVVFDAMQRDAPAGDVVSGDAIQGDSLAPAAAAESDGDVARIAIIADPAQPGGDEPYPSGGAGFMPELGGCIGPWIGIGGWESGWPIRIGRPWIEKIPGDVLPGDDTADGDGVVAGGGESYDYSGDDHAYAGGGIGIDGDGFDDYAEGGYGYDDGSYSSYASYYGTYTSTALGDVNGDGFEDYLVEGYGNSYVWYGYESYDTAYDGDGSEAIAAGDYGEGDATYVVYDGDVLCAPCVEPLNGHEIFSMSAGDGDVAVAVKHDGWALLAGATLSVADAVNGGIIVPTEL